jgi:hypothetical protein
MNPAGRQPRLKSIWRKESQMKRSVNTLLESVVDYAGLFPPASLPLEQSLRNYAELGRSAQSWMLGRFVCPVSALNDLGPLTQALFASDEPCPVSAIGAEHPLRAESVRDLRQIGHFRHTYGQQAFIDALEVRLPHETITDWDELLVAEGLNVLAGRLSEHGFNALGVFVEPVFDGDWNDTIQNVVAALRKHDVEHGDPAPNRIGLKLRTGGAVAGNIPTPEQLAFAILTCRESDIPLKLTAGLHQPLYHFDTPLATYVHGFLNVLVAAVLAQARGIDEATVQQILTEKDAHAFDFDDERVRWRELEATNGEIETARRELLVAFGSCSFDEPRHALQKLNLL